MPHISPKTDNWEQGYKDGLDYLRPPLNSTEQSSAYAFGYSAGLKERNRLALKELLND